MPCFVLFQVNFSYIILLYYAVSVIALMVLMLTSFRSFYSYHRNSSHNYYYFYHSCDSNFLHLYLYSSNHLNYSHQVYYSYNSSHVYDLCCSIHFIFIFLRFHCPNYFCFLSAYCYSNDTHCYSASSLTVLLILIIMMMLVW